jgi:monoamine oxidase
MTVTEAGINRQGKPPTIVIIGAGAAGAVAAYRLRQLMGPSASITVLEGSSRIGGRARHVSFAGSNVEVGASILHTAGRRLLDLAGALDVALEPAGGGPGGLGVWTGEGFSLLAAPGALESELLARYGQESVLGMVSVAQDVAAARSARATRW